MMKNLIFIILFIFGSLKILAQTNVNSIVMDLMTNEPIELVTVYNEDGYSITNEEGKFSISTNLDSLNIRIIGYQSIKEKTSYFADKDTIFLKPKPFTLDEVVISSEDFFQKMAKKVLTDYALLPHKEKFFLRALLKKNNEIHKLVDIEGLLERQTLYDTESIPMPDVNYKVQVNNIRKAEASNESFDFKMYDLQGFLDFIASNKMPPSMYKFDYRINKDSSYTKVIASPKSGEFKTNGHYIVNRKTLNFEEFFVTYNNPDADYIQKKDFKYRFVNYTLSVEFEENPLNGKKQLKQAKVKEKLELKTGESLDFLDMSYHFIATPISIKQKIKKNAKLQKDIFKLKGKYDAKRWDEQQELVLTQEMKKFISNTSNKTNSLINYKKE